MNQVQELFRLNDSARLDEALSRLGGLFDVMAQQPGFLHAEVTRDTAEPKTLLVLHAWARLEDWQAVQTSRWKLDFMARRPDGLYNPVPIGMNWTLISGEPAPSGRYIRRTLAETHPTAVHGQTFSAAATDDSYPTPYLTLEHRETPASNDGWYEVLLTRDSTPVSVAG